MLLTDAGDKIYADDKFEILLTDFSVFVINILGIIYLVYPTFTIPRNLPMDNPFYKQFVLLRNFPTPATLCITTLNRITQRQKH